MNGLRIGHFLFLCASLFLLGRGVSCLAMQTTDVDLHGQAMRQAIQNGQITRVEMLFDAGEPVDATDGVGRTTLMHAAFSGRLPMVRFLLKHDADANKEDLFATSALVWAIHGVKENLPLVKLLFEHTQSSQARQDALVAAATFKQHSVMKYLLSLGVAPDGISRQSGYTALIASAEAGDLGGLALLVHYAARINTPDQHGYTALMMAAYEHHLSAARFLLNHSASVNGKDKEGRSVMTWAREVGGSEGGRLTDKQNIIHLLKEAGAQ